MYADIDKNGRVSIFELTESEVESLLEGLKHYKDYCNTATSLFSDREDLYWDGQVMAKLIGQIESVIQEEEKRIKTTQ